MAFLLKSDDGEDTTPRPTTDEATPYFNVRPPQYDYVEKGFGEGKLQQRDSSSGERK